MAVADVNQCQTTLDCSEGKVCAYSTFTSRNICVDPASVTVGGNVGSQPGANPTVGGNVGSGSGTKPTIGGNVGSGTGANPTIGGNIGSAVAYINNGISPRSYAKFPIEADPNSILNGGSK
ncbi:unnamed protein product [Strongylus vulgaris]|uniref:Uncharacterized protein n=1 Tax=Strongylus vulgaris TaxID=40348 RepID=A0A3P7IIZ7_STRVU|nr:unnamed protein product [Strongylus vulgaris]